MRVRDLQAFIETHYDDFPNFDGRTPLEVRCELPDIDPRYEQGEAGLIELLNEIEYRPLPIRACWYCGVREDASPMAKAATICPYPHQWGLRSPIE